MTDIARMHISEIITRVGEGSLTLKWSNTVPRIKCRDCGRWRTDDGTRCRNCDTYDRPKIRVQFDYYLRSCKDASVRVLHYKKHEKGLKREMAIRDGGADMMSDGIVF